MVSPVVVGEEYVRARGAQRAPKSAKEAAHFQCKDGSWGLEKRKHRCDHGSSDLLARYPARQGAPANPEVNMMTSISTAHLCLTIAGPCHADSARCCIGCGGRFDDFSLPDLPSHGYM